MEALAGISIWKLIVFGAFAVLGLVLFTGLTIVIVALLGPGMRAVSGAMSVLPKRDRPRMPVSVRVLGAGVVFPKSDQPSSPSMYSCVLSGSFSRPTRPPWPADQARLPAGHGRAMETLVVARPCRRYSALHLLVERLSGNQTVLPGTRLRLIVKPVSNQNPRDRES